MVLMPMMYKLSLIIFINFCIDIIFYKKLY